MASMKDRELRWGKSTVETACPLDCPDNCTLEVSVEKGKVVSIDGGRRHSLTDGFICAKVRGFANHVYSEDRILYPAVRKGPKGRGELTRVSWDEALNLIASNMREIKARDGGEAILPFCYGGSNGLLTQDTNDAELFRRFGTSRLARTVCAAPTGAASLALYGKMSGVAYPDYHETKLIIIWGANPNASSVHLVPFVREAQKRGAALVVIDPRTTPLAKHADIHLAIRPGTDLPIALAMHRYLFENGFANEEFLAEHATGREGLERRAAEWTIERAAGVAGIDAGDLARVAELYASTSPAVIRCGWGIERNRNGGHAAMAILALPAVAGKFGVRGGGYSMSTSPAWHFKNSRWIDAPEPEHPHRQHEPAREGADGISRSDDTDAVRLQRESGRDHPRSEHDHPRPDARRPLHRRLRSGEDRHGDVRRRGVAGDDVSGELRHCAGVWVVCDADGAAGDRARWAKRAPTWKSSATSPRASASRTCPACLVRIRAECPNRRPTSRRCCAS